VDYDSPRKEKMEGNLARPKSGGHEKEANPKSAYQKMNSENDAGKPSSQLCMVIPANFLDRVHGATILF